MSQRTKYKNNVKFWLVKTYGWTQDRAKDWINKHDPYVTQLWQEGVNTFQAANYLYDIKDDND